MFHTATHYGDESKTTMKYHFTAQRMTHITARRNNHSWWGCGKKETLIHYGENVDWLAFLENKMDFS